MHLAIGTVWACGEIEAVCVMLLLLFGMYHINRKLNELAIDKLCGRVARLRLCV